MIDTSHHFKFELVAPEKVEVSGLEERVQLPGTEGDFTVLAGHQLLLASLRPGIVSVIRPNETVRYFIDGGMADIGNEHCMVLTPQIIPVSKMDAEKLEEELELLENQIAEAMQRVDIDGRDVMEARRDLVRIQLNAIYASRDEKHH